MVSGLGRGDETVTRDPDPCMRGHSSSARGGGAHFQRLKGAFLRLLFNVRQSASTKIKGPRVLGLRDFTVGV